MRRIKRSILPILVIVTAIFTSWAIAASAQAYLHVANATDYARGHVWRTFCNYGNNCSYYPVGTGWYQRISDSYVRTEIKVYRYGYGTCTRVFAVRGSDAAPYITTDGSAPYYTCR